jgi:ankyrin repeat protein
MNNKKEMIDKAIIQDNNKLLASVVEFAEIDSIDEEGYTLLQRSCLTGSFRCIQFLLESGANPNIANVDRYTPLHISVLSMVDNSIQLRALLEYQADPTARLRPSPVGGMVRDWTPLMLAAAEGHAISVGILAGEGGVIDAVDCIGMTALMLAASQTCEPEAKVLALLDSGASSSIRSFHGWSALDYARGHFLNLAEACSDPAAHRWIRGIKSSIDRFLRFSGRIQDGGSLHKVIRSECQQGQRVIQILRAATRKSK